ncbi:MAG TPA: serine/threonine-protein kinase [Polyangiales bacterium]|nr:serine/threonine-protein kinase [Polyangiales bacterium]
MSTAATTSRRDSIVGQVLDGRYRVDAVLGTGAVGAVYRARDIESGQVVALKQWHAGRIDEQVHGRFLREAAVLDALDHPGIVKVIGHGFVDAVPYVALEYLDGETLESLVTQGKPLEPALAFEITRQALAAVAYAHERDVVHRDLKPENIFLANNGTGAVQVKILDYGLAKFMQPAHDPNKGVALTMTGMIMGTPLYMPPEQAAGSSVDLAVDVYALGCVFFEMLAGRPPFLAETNLELLGAHLRAPIPKLAEAVPEMEIAPELQALIDRAMAKKQTERFPNARAMLEALQRIPQPALTPKRPVTTDSRITLPTEQERAKRSHKALAPLLVGAAVLLALAVFALLH